jgi:hypothetical protein
MLISRPPSALQEAAQAHGSAFGAKDRKPPTRLEKKHVDLPRKRTSSQNHIIIHAHFLMVYKLPRWAEKEIDHHYYDPAL